MENETMLPANAVDVRPVNGKDVPATTSLMVAEYFERNHRDVLRGIREVLEKTSDEFGLRNFAQSSYLNEQGKEQPMYLLTRDGFTMVAMGYTGDKAMRFKEAYIAAFNKMEARLEERAAERPSEKPADIFDVLGFSAPFRAIALENMRRDVFNPGTFSALTNYYETACGLSGTKLAAAVDRAVHNMCGVSPLEIGGVMKTAETTEEAEEANSVNALKSEETPAVIAAPAPQRPPVDERDAEVQEQAKKDRDAQGKRLAAIRKIDALANDPQRRDKFVRALADSGRDFSNLTLAGYYKLQLEMAIYGDDAPWHEIANFIDLRGLYQREWAPKKKKELPKAKEVVPRQRRTRAHGGIKGDVPDAFGRAYAYIVDAIFPTTPPADGPVSAEECELRLIEYLSLEDVPKCNLLAAGKAAGDALDRLFFEKCGAGARCLMPWSWYLSLYLCSLPYERGLELLYAAGEVVLENLRLPTVEVGTIVKLTDLPVIKPFRDTYILGKKGSGEMTELAWDRKHFVYWENMLNCFVFSLIGRRADKSARALELASRLLSCGEHSDAAKSAFLPVTGSPALGAYVRKDGGRPRTVIFRPSGEGTLRTAINQACSYLAAHGKGFENTGGYWRAITNLLRVPVQTAQVGASDWDLLKYGGLYSPDRLW